MLQTTDEKTENQSLDNKNDALCVVFDYINVWFCKMPSYLFVGISEWRKASRRKTEAASILLRC